MGLQMETKTDKRRILRLPIMIRRKRPRPASKNEQKPSTSARSEVRSMADDHAPARLAEEARLVATLRAGPYAHKDAVDPTIADTDPLNPWAVAKRREWFVRTSARKIRKIAEADAKKGRKRFEVSLTVAHPGGLIELDRLSPADFKSRRRFHERRLPRISGKPYLAGYIDVTLNQDPHGVLRWQLHEHLIVSLRAKSISNAKKCVQSAYAIRDKAPILRPVMVGDATTPQGFLEYASKAAHVINLWRRIGFLGSNDNLIQRDQPVKRKHQRIWLAVLERLKPHDRMIFGGLRREGDKLRKTKCSRKRVNRQKPSKMLH